MAKRLIDRRSCFVELLDFPEFGKRRSVQQASLGCRQHAQFHDAVTMMARPPKRRRGTGAAAHREIRAPHHVYNASKRPHCAGRLRRNHRRYPWRPARVEDTPGHRQRSDRRSTVHPLPQAATVEAGAASTAPNDLGNRVQRSGAGRWARNHLGDHLHERGGGRQRRQGGMGAHDDDCSGGW